MSKIKLEGNATGTGTLTISAPATNTDRALTLPDGAGEILTDASTLSSSNLSGALPAIDGSALTGVGGIFESALFHIREEQPSGTSNIGLSSGWNTRIINTVKTNEITGASISSNQFTLPAGTYYLTGYATAYATGNTKMAIRNVTDSSYEIYGGNGCIVYTHADTQQLSVDGRFTISAEKDFELHQYVQTSNNAQTGTATSSGLAEVYLDLRIWKVS